MIFFGIVANFLFSWLYFVHKVTVSRPAFA